MPGRAAVRSVLVTAFAPSPTGNGSAMRAHAWHRGLSRLGPTQVFMAPVAGMAVPGGVEELALPTPEERTRGLVELAQDPRWRRFLSNADPLPPTVQAAPPWLGRHAAPRVHGRPDVIVAFKAGLAPVGLDLAWSVDAPLVVDLDDDEVAVFEQLGDDRAAAAARRLRRELAEHAQTLCVASALDATLMRGELGRPVAVVPNGIEAPDEPTPPARVERPIVLFVGNLTYAPNVLGLRWFVTDVLAHVDVALHIRVIGAGGHAALADLPASGCEVLGAVDDLAPHYREASVVICPLLAGSGTRLKVLEALAWARPVVSTTIGVAGLDLVAGRDVLVADDAAAFAAAVTDLVAAPQRATGLGRAGWATVRERHGPGRVDAAIASLV